MGAIVGVLVAWWFGNRTVGDSQKAILYDRLREARELVGRINVSGGAILWHDCDEATAQLRAVLGTVAIDLPATRKLAATAWTPTSYYELGLQEHVAAARAELEQATRELLS